ncbi:trna isopentenyltransferase [Diplodia corticola]|uniref:tRNA dimethylallyltransferase n=1 Tax=Diplodia corticola TaxID=236234 RepID=A0A1J9R1S6_9PEZI|nr:trna isopentenyltransferase [Diplodia corticola]OJD34202.1 trna isopentenyltransferase [Diplodia corticola]
MARCPSRKPVIAVIGATGTGKSQLAVELARRFNGEIVNSDAMQLYEGLPVITNKITQEEMQSVPHHLLGTITLSEDTWTVTEFVKRALRVVDDIHSRGKLPIIVGGTHYYIQSLLFKDSLADQQTEEEPKPEDADNDSENYPILDEPTEVILAKLQEVDPVMADRWHPNDRRKIQRSLQIWLKTGKPASQMYEEQSVRKREQQQQQQPVTAVDDMEETGEGKDQDPTSPTQQQQQQQRFPALLFWVHADPSTLRARLDARVEKMLANGLLAEVASLDAFLQQREAEGHPVDRTRGIWVSIGFKEFEAYQRALTASSSSSTTSNSKELALLRARAIEHVQAATRQYAKRQLRWIRIKLLNALANSDAPPPPPSSPPPPDNNNTTTPLYLLDATHLPFWTSSVSTPALDLTAQFLLLQDQDQDQDGEQQQQQRPSMPPPTTLSPAAAEMLTPRRGYDLSARPDLWRRRACETCGTVAVTEADWERHVRSRGHRVREKKRRERERETEKMRMGLEGSKEGEGEEGEGQRGAAGVEGQAERRKGGGDGGGRQEAEEREEGAEGEDVEAAMAAFDGLVGGERE